MRQLVVFNSVTLGGYFSGEDGDISWAHTNKDDPECKTFVTQNAKAGGMFLGSGTIVSQLTQQGLIDEYHVVLNPVLLGKGRTMFDGIRG